MAIMIWVLRVLFFLVVFAFASRNLTPVDVQGFLGLHWSAPLALVLLSTLLVGVLLGVYGTLRMWWVLRSVPPKPIKEDGDKPSFYYRKPRTALGADEGA